MIKDDIIKSIFGILLAIIGYFVVNSFNSTNASLSNINAEIVSIRLKLTELNAKILTEERVREIVLNELHRQNISINKNVK